MTPLRTEELIKALRGATRWFASLPLRSGIENGNFMRSLPSPVGSVLFVCKGNICRSPLAAAYVAAQLGKLGRSMEVRSAGLETTAGKKADPMAIAVARWNNLSLEGHITTPLTPELVDGGDVILVMESAQRSELLRRYPGANGKVIKLGTFNRMLSSEIPDPYGGKQADFERCYESITRSCDGLIKHLVAK